MQGCNIACPFLSGSLALKELLACEYSCDYLDALDGGPYHSPDSVASNKE